MKVMHFCSIAKLNDDWITVCVFMIGFAMEGAFEDLNFSFWPFDD